MQKARFVAITVFAIIATIFMPASMTAQYTEVGEELRPFDFTDKYYEMNGVNPKMIINRRTGFDKNSVVDYSNKDIHRNVRITGTWPMDDYKGDISYVAVLGKLSKAGFTEDKAGNRAIETAHRFPFYVFPSRTVKNSERQAAVAETGGNYFEENPLGLSIIVEVKFTRKAFSKEGQIELEKLLGHNGKTLDGTLAIRKVSEIDYLAWKGFVTQETTSSVAYKIKQVIKDPTKGAIAPDAVLTMVLGPNQKPLDSERMFYDHFECLQKTGAWCE